MAFGWPTSYYRLNLAKISGGVNAYNRAIREATKEYKSHTVRNVEIGLFFFYLAQYYFG